MNQALLDVRKEIKERKPIFIRQDNPKRMKLNYKWRKPKGIHSKIRHHFKGRRKMPSPGYKSPAEVKGLHDSGLKIVNVFSIDDIAKINKNGGGAVISKKIGQRKKIEILRKAKELNVKILNLNMDAHIKKIEDFISLKKKKATESKKEEKKPLKAAKPDETKEEKEMTDDQKKETEKKERDKLLTKKV